MDKVVNSLGSAYEDFVDAAANVLENKEKEDCDEITTDFALENFNQKRELFKVACDQAEEFVGSIKQRILSEWVVDDFNKSVTEEIENKPVIEEKTDQNKPETEEEIEVNKPETEEETEVNKPETEENIEVNKPETKEDGKSGKEKKPAADKNDGKKNKKPATKKKNT